MNEQEIAEYINKYLTILNNNFTTYNEKKIPYNDIRDMMDDLQKLFASYYKINEVECSKLSSKKYIPLLNLMLKIDKRKESTEQYFMATKEAYRMAARTSLEAYFMYREWEEPYTEKFFAPRIPILKGYIHYLEEIALNPKFRLLIANLPSGYGKLLANDTPILTKNGWKKHGDLVVGDYVIAPNGEYVRVNYVHPKRFANTKVEFEDGEVIYCHNQHEWQVYDKSANKEKHIETNYMFGKVKMKDGRNRFYVPSREIFKGEYKDLPIDPYTYGVWLGDGSTSQSRITQNIEDSIIFDYIPYEITNIYKGASDKVNTYQVKGLAEDLHKIGLCYQNHKEEKYIHDSYLTSSIEQRLDLLAGLIDTDGYLDKKKNRYIIVTCGEKLKDSIISLISTFDWRTSITIVKPKISTSGIKGTQNTYYIGFNATIKIPCKLKRKQMERVNRKRRIGIKNIELCDVQVGNCITVDGGLYLAGKTLKMTHNTYTEKIAEAWNFGIDPTGTVLSLCSNDDVVKSGSRTVRDEMKSEWFGEVFPKMKWNEEDKDYFLKETDGRWKIKQCRLGASYVASTTNSNVVGDRASQRIHIDDLYADYQEAMGQNLNEYYFNKFLTVWRKRFVQNKEPKVVVTGTLWASGDFIALLIETAKKENIFHKHPKYPYTYINEDETIAIVQVPALDYETGLSTCPELRTTEQIEAEKRNIPEYLFETNFQQRPTDPDALLFSYNILRTYTNLPAFDSEASYAVIDATRKTGKDYFSMPIFKKSYEEEHPLFYLTDCLFTQKATKDLYQEICDKIIQNHIVELVIESNVTTELSQNISKILEANGVYFCKIREKYNVENKGERIVDQSFLIQKRMVFPAKDKFPLRSEIGQFMNNLTLYNSTGRNQHDDAPDSLSLASKEFIDEGTHKAKITIFKRPF